ncbi:MAG: SDR family oxidoreductase [Candidatus Dormiibacterota bacterium]
MSRSKSSPAALVTGAGRGIGRSAALELARRGYDVAVNYSRSAEAAQSVADEVATLGVRSLVVKADVADESQVADMVRRVELEFGRLDALVNNAGMTVPTPPTDISGLDMADWDRVFAVNVRGMFQVTRACVPMLNQSGSGAVVNLCSIAGLRPGAQPFPYAASKAAVANLTRTLAGALGPKIRVNAVAPGWMSGEWMEHVLGDNYERLMERRASLTPLKRCVTPDEVAITIVNLIASNPMVTGEIVVIDGGFSATT